MIENQKEQINKWIRLKIEQVIIRLLKKCPEKMKNDLKDPSMMKCFQNSIDNLIDELWPEMEQIILHQLKLKISKPYINKPEKKKVHFCILPIRFLRSWYLYTVNPCKFSLFVNLRLIEFRMELN